MPVFNLFFKTIRKMLPALLIYLIAYFIIAFLMSSTAEKTSLSSFVASSLDLCIIDEDHSRASKALTDYLDSSHNLVKLRSTDAQSLQDNLFYGRIDYVLTIPEGFEENLAAGKYDNLVTSSKQNNSTDGYFADQQVDQYLNSLSLYLTSGYHLEEAIEKTNSAISHTEEVTIRHFQTKQTAQSDTTMFYFFQYMPYIMLLLIIMGITPVLVTFNQTDLSNRMNCSALSFGARNVQISLGCVAYTVTIWLLFMIAAGLIYGPAQLFANSGLSCVLNSFVFSLIAAAVSLLISAFSPSLNALNMICNVVALGMSFLCGVFVPLSYLSDQVVMVSRFLPGYWYIRINNMLGGFSKEPVSMDTYWMCIGIQLIFFAAIFVLYLVVSDQKRKSRAM